jgi:hypothetical protein
MVFQAYIDESCDQQSRTFVMAGHIATTEQWAAFSKEWEGALPRWGVITRDAERGDDYYTAKWPLLNKTSDRRERINWFIAIIKSYLPITIWCSFNENDLRAAISDVAVVDKIIEWEKFEQPWFVGFHCLMSMFFSNKERLCKFLPLDETVDFFFDEHADKKKIRDTWDAYVANSPENHRKFMRAKPIFRNDRDVVALQAADLMAGWTREWINRGKPQDDLPEQCQPDMAKRMRISFEFNRDALAQGLTKIL